ncbi:MAG: hypothetical protein KDE09_23520 [Anaerolineales bacterium]|nr:hypothetical protein [Anaerolineales bacterium]
MRNSSEASVQVGIGLARITQVTSMAVEYIDEHGQRHSIDLKECAQNWRSQVEAKRGQSEARQPPLSESARAWNERCVGVRDLLDDPPWVGFMNEQRTRFAFTSYAESYEQLLNPLGLAGWHTWDAG